MGQRHSGDEEPCGPGAADRLGPQRQAEATRSQGHLASFDDAELDRDLDVVELQPARWNELVAPVHSQGGASREGPTIMSQPGKPAPFVVIPAIVVKCDCMHAFLALAQDDASHSVADEPGCRQFDVVQMQ